MRLKKNNMASMVEQETDKQYLIDNVWKSCVGDELEGIDVLGGGNVCISKEQYGKDHEKGWEIMAVDKSVAASSKHFMHKDQCYVLISRKTLK